MTGAGFPDDYEIVYYAGYIIQPGVDLREYQDYYCKSFRLIDIRNDLKRGNLPIGLVLRDKYGTTAIVTTNGLRRI